MEVPWSCKYDIEGKFLFTDMRISGRAAAPRLGLVRNHEVTEKKVVYILYSHAKYSAHKNI